MKTYHRLQVLSFLIIVCILIFIVGCATSRVPIKLDPSFSTMGIKKITLLPIVDRRIDKSVDIDFEQAIRNKAAKNLESKGYTVLLPESFM